MPRVREGVVRRAAVPAAGRRGRTLRLASVPLLEAIFSSHMRVLPFEDPDPSFVPLAGRRALDRAGLKLSLRAWQSLSMPARAMIARLGQEDEVDVERVRSLLEGAEPAPEPIAPLDDPPSDAPPAEVRAALGPARPLSDEAWRALGSLGRYVLASYARRGRAEKLAAAYDSLVSRS